MADQLQPHLFLPLISLLLSITLPCSAYCPLASQDYRQCELYTALESALLADPRNLYRLHEEFFPSSRSSPIYGDVIYALPCMDHRVLSNSSSIEGSNTTLLNSTVFVYAKWSGSILLAYMSPQVINSFLLQLMNVMLSFATTATTNPSVLAELDFSPELRYLRYESYYLSLVLYLNSADRLVQCDLESVSAVYPVISDLTSWLKSYGRALRSRENWHPLDIIQYKGYSYTTREELQDSLLYNMPYLVLTIDILYLFFVAALMVKAAPSLYCVMATKSRRGNKWYSYVWATVVVATLINLTALAFELYGFRAEYVRSYFQDPCRECSQNILGYDDKFGGELKQAGGIHLYKSIAIFSIIVFDFFVALLLQKDSTFPTPRSCLYLSYGICCTFHYTHTKRSKLIQTFAIWSLMGFVHIVSTSILPVFLWAIVLPAETVSIVTLLVAVTFCSITFLSLVIRNIHKVCFKTMTVKGACAFLLPIATLLFLMSIIVIASIIYIRLISTRIETSTVGGFLVTFLPSVVLTVLGWIITKGNPVTFIVDRKWQDSEPEEEKDDVFSGSEADPTVAIKMEAMNQTANGLLKEPLLTT